MDVVPRGRQRAYSEISSDEDIQQQQPQLQPRETKAIDRVATACTRKTSSSSYTSWLRTKDPWYLRSSKTREDGDGTLLDDDNNKYNDNNNEYEYEYEYVDRMMHAVVFVTKK